MMRTRRIPYRRNRQLFAPTLCGVLVLGAALLALAACGNDDGAANPDASLTETTRQVLASAMPDTAAGQELGLHRVVIPAGAALPSHVHPGVQMAYIASGTLTYSIQSGEVVITRNAGMPDERDEVAGEGATVEIHAGDALVELPGLVHSSRNDGDEPVVIFLTTLFEAGAPASSPVE